MEKAMKLKPTEAVYFGYQTNGRIYIEQRNEVYSDVIRCYLSPEQFRAIENWFFTNKDAIDAAWNMGVEDDPKA
jgi:hypothetical protein